MNVQCTFISSSCIIPLQHLAALIEKRFTMHGPSDANSITFDTKAAFRNTRDSISFRDVMFVSLHLSLNIDL